jgi:hypothetical protein
MRRTLAPIAAFAYKRPEHIGRMLHSLRRNVDLASSDLYVFCDGPRSPDDNALVDATRSAVRAAAPSHAKIIERNTNAGLAASITEGVTRLTAQYGRVIVLEDDLVVSPFTLRYFNDALTRYQEEERVMHISGYMFPVDAMLPETFFYREATCWGWATWARAWRKFEPDGRKILEHVVRNGMTHEFNVRGSMGFLSMLEAQIAGKVDSWAIRWYGSMWIAGGLALHPGASLVSNLGFDGTGEHCSATSAFDVRLRDGPVERFETQIRESEQALAAMIAYRAKHWGKAPGIAQRARLLFRRIAGRI